MVVCTLLAPGAAVEAQAVARQPFSSEEKALLKAGKLVTRSAEERRGNQRLIGGASWQVINLPADSVWKALLDTPHYHRMLPQVHRAMERVNRPDYKRVTIQHKTGPFSAQYDLGARIYPERHDVTFKVEKTPDSSLSAAWGFITVRPYGPDRSLIAYGIMADLGEGIIGTLVKSTVHEWMLKVPLTMKWFMEGSGRKFYAPG